MKRLSILGSVLLLVFMGILSSGCFHDEDEAEVDCAETFCVGTLLAEGEGFNSPLIEAVNLAKIDINEAGGNIEIISGNSFQAGKGEAVESATRLLEMGVRGMVAPSYSSDSLDVHPFLSENQMVAISPSATSPTLTEENKELVGRGDQPFFFRVAPSDLFQGPILAKQSLGKTVIVNRNDAWGAGLAEIVHEEITSSRRQAEIVSYSAVSQDDDPDFVSDVVSGAVSDVEAAVQTIGNVSSLVILAFNEGGKIIRGLLDSLVIPDDVGYYAGDGLVFRDDLFPLVDYEGGAIEGFQRVTTTPLPNEMLEEFKKRFDPDTFNDYTAQAYDAVVILSLAALSAQSHDPSDYVSKIQEVTKGGEKCYTYATCAAALTDETATNDDIDYEGLSGPIDLDDNGDITAGTYVVETYDNTGVPEKTYLDFEGQPVTVNAE